MSGTMGLMRYNNRERISRHLTTFFFGQDQEKVGCSETFGD